MEAVADLANEAISHREQAGENPLDIASEARATDNDGAP